VHNRHQSQEKSSLNAQKKQNFSQRLRLIREKRGFSQKDFAKKIGLSGHAQVSRYENGKSLPDVAVLERVGRVLDVDLHWLITGKPSPGVTRIADSIRSYAIAHLSEVTINLQKLERERRDLYARDAQGESLRGAIEDVELLIEKQHRYYEKAFRDIDEALDIATHEPKGVKTKKAQPSAHTNRNSN